MWVVALTYTSKNNVIDIAWQKLKMLFLFSDFSDHPRHISPKLSER